MIAVILSHDHLSVIIPENVIQVILFSWFTYWKDLADQKDGSVKFWISEVTQIYNQFVYKISGKYTLMSFLIGKCSNVIRYPITCSSDEYFILGAMRLLY